MSFIIFSQIKKELQKMQRHIQNVNKCTIKLSYIEAWWYTTPLASQLIRKQVGGFIFDVGFLGPCGKHAEEAEDVASMPRTLPRHAQDVAKHAKEAEDVAKHAYTSQVPTVFINNRLLFLLKICHIDVKCNNILLHLTLHFCEIYYFQMVWFMLHLVQFG